MLGLVLAAGGWGYTAFRFGQISSVHVPGLGKAPSDGSVNLLVVGSDTRQGLRQGGFGDAGGQRSDVIIVVHLVPGARHAAVLSIPRDLYVPVAGTGGSAKINSAFNHGPGQLVQTIQHSFGIPIHHYLLVNFDGFREVVDALGGVALSFPRPVRDSNDGHNESGLNVPRTGCQRLGGNQALALARSRYFQYQDKAGRWHTDPGTDLGRIRRQQTMLRSLAAKALGRNLDQPDQGQRPGRLRGPQPDQGLPPHHPPLRYPGPPVPLLRPARLTTLTLPSTGVSATARSTRRPPGFDPGLRQGGSRSSCPASRTPGHVAKPPPAPPARPLPPRHHNHGSLSTGQDIGHGQERHFRQASPPGRPPA